MLCNHQDGNLVMQAQKEQVINEVREKSEKLAKLETKLSLLRDQHEVYQVQAINQSSLIKYICAL